MDLTDKQRALLKEHITDLLKSKGTAASCDNCGAGAALRHPGEEVVNPAAKAQIDKAIDKISEILKQ